MSAPVVVKLTFHRIQSFLFAVPRLRSIVGANALLGETIRKQLVKRVNGSIDLTSRIDHEYLDKLQETPDDPLKLALDSREVATTNILRDHPRALYQKGILSRDGGHFLAMFANNGNARSFVTEANRLLTEKLPGLAYEIEPSCESSSVIGSNNNLGEDPVRLPHFEVCQHTATEVAAGYDPITKNTGLPKRKILRKQVKISKAMIRPRMI